MNSGKDAPNTLIHGIRMKRAAQKDRKIDIPEGDPLIGKQLYIKNCAGMPFFL